MKGIIYLICDPLTDSFKIGVTKRDVIKRLKELQTGSSGELFIKSTFNSNHPYQLEKMLHKKYFSKKMINEWFALDIDDINDFLYNCDKYESILNSIESFKYI